MGRDRSGQLLKLSVITACTRPQNLGTIAISIFAGQPEQMHINWLVRRDLIPAVGGQAVKNALLDEFEDGWVCFLDDDTIMHPSFKERISGEVAKGGVDMILYGQKRGPNDFPPQPRRGTIDIGQVCVRRERIDGLRIPEEYDGDGAFIEELVHAYGAEIVVLDEVLSFYNALLQ